MKRLRTVLFWLHLAAGLAGGLVIFVMCITGAALAFEKEIVGWAERDVRRVVLPADAAARLPLDVLLRKAGEARPDARATAIVLSADPGDAVALQFGREAAVFIDPHTGVARTTGNSRTRDFMRIMEDWHRVLAVPGDSRPVGRAINGACNLAFFFLAVSGLYLWWPRSWSWRGLRAVTTLDPRLSGKARDFNWHNAIGFWSAPILIVLTLTALPISYRWAGNLIYTIAGEKAPDQRGPGGFGGPVVEVTPPAPGARLLAYDALPAGVESRFPGWETLTLRLGGNPRGGPGQGRSQGARPATDAAARMPALRDAETPRTEHRSRSPDQAAPRTAVTVAVRQPRAWPRTAVTTVVIDPYTGEELKREDFSDLSLARRIRSWTRFLHTGEAVGWIGQLAAGLACLGGCFLVYTGFTLASRRFFGPKPPVPAATDLR